MSEKFEKKDKLEFFRELVSCIHNIYFSEYDAATFEPIYSSAPLDRAIHFFLSLDMSKEQWKNIKIPSGSTARAAIGTNSLGMAWVIELEYMDKIPKTVHVMGPVFLSDFSLYYIMSKLDQYNLSSNLRSNFMDFVSNLPIVSLIRLYEYAVTFHYCFTGEKITISEVMHLEAPVRKLFDNEPVTETIPPDENYMTEQKIIQLVRTGNLQYRKEMDKLISFGDIRDLSFGGNFRQAKNYVIIFTSMCCRASMEGGLNPKTAYALSDYYIEIAEQCNNLSALTETSHKMVDDFVRHVHRCKISDGISPQVRTACDLIEINPQQQFDIHAIAESFGYTDYYFTKKFKKETGMTLKEYHNLKRVELAKKLLTTTTLSIIEISGKTGFGNQSYFGDYFRRITGVSPREYRINGNEKNKE